MAAGVPPDRGPVALAKNGKLGTVTAFSAVRGYIIHYLVQVLAFLVEVGIGIVFCDAPHAVLLVPEGRPARMFLQETSHPRGFLGRGEASHARLPNSMWRGRPCLSV